MYIPDELKYSGTHTWAELQDDGLVKVGITDHAQQQLGNIIYIELPDTERSYTNGEECAVIESANSASDVYCPIAGDIVEVNIALSKSPSKINADPYGDGWIFLISPDDVAELDELIDADTYDELIDGYL